MQLIFFMILIVTLNLVRILQICKEIVWLEDITMALEKIMRFFYNQMDP